METYMTDKRLKDYKDFTQHSKYSGTYMENQEFYNNAKPFVHLKLDQICRKTHPADEEDELYDYELKFDSDKVFISLILTSENPKIGDKLYSWQTKVSESINSVAIKEFGATDAFPDDELISNMLKNLSIKLENTPIDRVGADYIITALSAF